MPIFSKKYFYFLFSPELHLFYKNQHETQTIKLTAIQPFLTNDTFNFEMGIFVNVGMIGLNPN
jgi:hypothetical protein